MRIITCKDLGINCDFVAKAPIALGALAIISSHVMKEHPKEVAEKQKTMSRGELMKWVLSKAKKA